MVTAAFKSAVALLIGACGGAIFAFFGLPLPWTLGAMAASGLSAVFWNRWPMPGVMRDLARPVVGVLAGSAFTPAIWGMLVYWWPAVGFVLLFAVATTALGYLVFTRVARLDPTTAFFASAPGGLGELALLGGSLGGSARTIALIHSVRIVSVVFGIPVFLSLLTQQDLTAAAPVAAHQGAMHLVDWLLLAAAGAAGYEAGRRGWLPGGELVGAMLFSALVHGAGLTESAPPQWLVIFAQVLIGSVTGSRFAGITAEELRGTVLLSLLWAGFLLLMTGSVAALAAAALAVDFPPLLLALAPGGTAEMIIVTYALGGEVAFVSVCQISRIFLILSLVPILHRRVLARRAR
jgi:uncharacterized protein